MIGRLDPQKGFDLAGRRGAGAARARRHGSSCRAAATRRSPTRSARSPRRSPDRVALIERFDRVMARRIYAGADFFADALAVRAVRPGPDDRAALRDAADRPSHGRPGGHGHRRDAAPGRGDRLRLRRTRPPTALLGACERAIALRAAGGPAWDGLLDRGMAVDFDWATGSAPRYVEAYRRAVAIRAASADRALVERAAGARRPVSTGCVPCGECGAPAIVITWSAPYRAANVAATPSGMWPPVAGSPRTSRTRDRRRPGPPAPPGRQSQSPFSSRTCRAGLQVGPGRQLDGVEVARRPAPGSRPGRRRAPPRGSPGASPAASVASRTISASGIVGGSSSTSRDGRRPAAGRLVATIAPQLWATTCRSGAVEPGRPDERDQVGGRCRGSGRGRASGRSGHARAGRPRRRAGRSPPAPARPATSRPPTRSRRG